MLADLLWAYPWCSLCRKSIFAMIRHMKLILIPIFFRMAFYPARDAVQKSLGFETECRQPTAVEHYGVTTIMFVILLAFGITVHSLGKVYAVVGGLASAYLAFIIPSLSYLRAFRPSWIRQTPVDECVPLLQTSYKQQVPKPTWWLDVTSIILLLFGSVIMLFTAISAFK